MKRSLSIKQKGEPEVGKKDNKEVPSNQEDVEPVFLEVKLEEGNKINSRTLEVNRKMRDVMKELIDKDVSDFEEESVTGNDSEDSLTVMIKVESDAEIDNGDKVPRESLTVETTNESSADGPRRRSRESKGKRPSHDDFVYEWEGNRMKGKRRRHEESDGKEEGREPLVQKKKVAKRELVLKSQETKVKSGTSRANENGRKSKVSGPNTRKMFKESDGDHFQPNSNKVTTRKGSKQIQNEDITISCKNLQVITSNTKKSLQEQTAECKDFDSNELNNLVDNHNALLENQDIKEEEGISYVILPNATQRGKKKLISSNGFTYNVKHNLKDRRVWACSHRPKKKPSCRAFVKENLDCGKFELKGTHHHAPNSAALVNSYIVSEIKKKSKTDFLSNPKDVIEKILLENVDLNTAGCKFNIDYLIRSFNRVRHTLKQKNPTIGIVKMKNIPKDFLQEDVIYKDNRLMIFSTTKQLQLLSRSDRWYMDITQKFVCRPFEYLMSISAYVLVKDSGDIVMLKPLAFILLSHAEMGDFIKAIRGLLKHLKKPLCIRSFVLDFYPGLWSAIRNLFFNCKLYGCAWKFGQTLWTKVQEYGKKEEIIQMNNQIHKLLKLPFLPAREIRLAFQLLKEDFCRFSSFEQLIDHIENAWLNNSVWRITNWSVFGSPFRTKSDVISWHYSISLIKNRIPLGNLIHELHGISCSLSSVQKPVHQGNVKKFYKENLKTAQGKMFLLWEEESVMSHSEFLGKCCQFSEPSLEVMVKKIS